MALELERGYQVVQAWLAERARRGMDDRDPRRETPQGEFKLPAFVNFHFLDPGSDCDEIFWQRTFPFTHVLLFYHLT